MVLPTVHTISLLHVGFWISGPLGKSLVQMYLRVNLVNVSKECCLHVLGAKQKDCGHCLCENPTLSLSMALQGKGKKKFN